jgi:hypothetical protein
LQQVTGQASRARTPPTPRLLQSVAVSSLMSAQFFPPSKDHDVESAQPASGSQFGASSGSSSSATASSSSAAAASSSSFLSQDELGANVGEGVGRGVGAAVVVVGGGVGLGVGVGAAVVVVGGGVVTGGTSSSMASPSPLVHPSRFDHVQPFFSHFFSFV